MKRHKSVRILNALDIKANLERMARAILRQNQALDSLGFIGIRTRGLFLARRLCEMIKESCGKDVPLGEMDITLYRDDLTRYCLTAKWITRKFPSTSITRRPSFSTTYCTQAGPCEPRWTISSI